MSETSLKTRLMATLEQNVALETRIDELTHEAARNAAAVESSRALQKELQDLKRAHQRAVEQNQLHAETATNLNRQLKALQSADKRQAKENDHLRAEAKRSAEQVAKLQRELRTHTTAAQERKASAARTSKRDAEVSEIVAEARAGLAKLGSPAVTPEMLDAAVSLALSAALNNDMVLTPQKPAVA